MNKVKSQTIEFNDLPDRLKEIPDAPAKLHVLGTLPDFNEYKFLTVVGSRAHSAYAKRALEHLLEGLAGYPVVIVSGLALGIDTLAHKTALKNQIKTIAVPGSGLSSKVLYPKSNFPLAKEILQKGGALISEFEMTQGAAPWTFPKRNRIMAALADLVLVIEAKEKSGTLITARLALEYNKDLAVVPSDIFSDFNKGALKFLKLGAYPVVTPQDVLELLDLKPEQDTAAKSAQQAAVLNSLSKQELALIQSLKEPLEKHTLQELSQLSAGEFAVAFSKLELKGLIKEELGKVFKTI